MKKILVIDDEAPFRKSIQIILKLKGFEAITAENGLVGLQLAKEKIPDLVISDIMLPSLDGYGVLKALRENPTTTNIPFILISAYDEWTHRCRARQLGAEDYLAKPFELAELMQAISTYLAD